jgi:hypothetical protein
MALAFVEAMMPKGFEMRCGACKIARVWLHGKGRGLQTGRAFVLLPAKEGKGETASAGYLSPLRQALIERNPGRVQVFVCESDYRTLKRGIDSLSPGVQ